MRLIDRQYTATPFFGVGQMTDWLRLQGHAVNPKRVRRLMGRKTGQVQLDDADTHTVHATEREYWTSPVFRP